MLKPPACQFCVDKNGNSTSDGAFVLEFHGKRLCVVCKYCGGLICNVTSQNELRDYQILETAYANKDFEFAIDIKNKNGAYEMRCGACDALLYNSAFPTPEGRFDTMHSNYCPNCGAKFSKADITPDERYSRVTPEKKKRKADLRRVSVETLRQVHACEKCGCTPQAPFVQFGVYPAHFFCKECAEAILDGQINFPIDAPDNKEQGEN